MPCDCTKRTLKIDRDYRDASERFGIANNRQKAAKLLIQVAELMSAKQWNDAASKLELFLQILPDNKGAQETLVAVKQFAQLPDLYRRALKAIDAKQWQDAKTLLELVLGVDVSYRESKMLLNRVTEEHRKAMLADLYDRSLQAMNAKRWEDAKALLEQIKGIDPNYRETSLQLVLVQKNIIARKITNLKDGKELLLIPAGEFVMGEGSQTHGINLDAFYISRFPVTNAEYKKFVAR